MVKLVENRLSLFTTKFARIIYSVPPPPSDDHQSVYEELKKYFPTVEFILDLPKPSDLMDNSLPKLILIDDQEFILLQNI